MNIIKACMIAISMYSKIPVPQFEWDEKSMRYALAFFPLPGIIIGLLQLFLFYFIYQNGIIGGGIYAALATVIPIAVTGGIHMDGYCDTIDALASCQPRERRLEILKDSHSGAFAVIWAGVYFVLCYGAWTQVHTYEAMQLIAVGYVVSRALSGLAALFFKNANKKGSLSAFTTPAVKGFVCTVLVVALAIAALLQIYISVYAGAFMLTGEAVMFLYYYIMSKKSFGGITGDLAGWFLQCMELLILYISVIGEFAWTL